MSGEQREMGVRLRFRKWSRSKPRSVSRFVRGGRGVRGVPDVEEERIKVISRKEQVTFRRHLPPCKTLRP